MLLTFVSFGKRGAICEKSGSDWPLNRWTPDRWGGHWNFAIFICFFDVFITVALTKFAKFVMNRKVLGNGASGRC